MPVPVLITDLSTVAASNYPQGSDTPSTLDDVQRAHASFIAALRNGIGTPVALASAATVDIGAQTVASVEISGTTAITSFGTNYNGPRYLRFTGALVLTHNATTLNLPGGANILTTAGDVAIAYPNLALSGWNVYFYSRNAAPGVPKSQDFRLTLTSNTPVTTADVTGASTLYLTPYKGNAISLYGGANWATYNTAQVSVSLSGLTAALPYDVWAYSNAGVVTLELLAWTSATARATALSYQDGCLVKSGDATRRYIGTIVPTAATTTEDSNANRYVWNYYNRMARKATRRDPAISWTYGSATVRYANANAANVLNFVVGVSEDVVTANVVGSFASTTAGVAGVVGIGLDSATAYATDAQVFTGPGLNVNVANYSSQSNAVYEGYPGVGAHALSWLENSVTGSVVYYGAANSQLSAILMA